ncbi:MAG TPA: two-component regulator propeller domain-containing protein [Pelobium sp.]|nr:two-component regulator propeller domain-containing protein [Pelobium sp.]
MKKFKTIIFLIALCISTIDGIAEDLSLNFMNLSTKDGLSSNTVNNMFKDRYGFMWFATADGLNKFDGKHFTIYRHNAKDPTSITSNEISDLYEDQKGNLWIGSTAGLMLYNRQSNSFTGYKVAGVGSSIASLSSDASGKIWVASYDGLWILNPETKKIELPKLKNASDKLLIKKAVLRVFRDKRNQIWLGTEDGLFLYQSQQQRFVRFHHKSSEPNSIVDNSVKAIFEDIKGNLWLGTNNGLSMFSADRKTFINYKYEADNKNTLSSNITYAVAGEQNGKIWVGTEEGLNIVDPITKKVQRIERNGRNDYSLKGKAVKSILIDKQGIYWVATFRSGVNKYDKNLAFFNLVQSNRYDPLGLSAPVVTSFVQAGEQSVYVGTDGAGLSLFDIPTRVFRHIPISGSKNDKLSILTMEKVGSDIWIGTYLQGLFIYNTKTGLSKQLKKGTGSEDLEGNNIFCIKKDSHGNVWVGTNGDGVDFYNLATKEVLNFNKDAQGKQKIDINGYVRVVEEDIEGNIWIGTNGSGIVIYDPITGSKRMLSRANKSLPSNNVTSIYCAQDGTVYIGTVGGGLTIYDQKQNRFSSYSEQNGLANAVIYKILEDNLGKIWVSTNSGISSFDIQTKKFKNYFYHNGIQQSPFVSGAGLKLQNGSLFFGGTDGFNYFNPAQLYTNKNVPMVVLTDLKISNQSVKPSDDGQITEDISIAKEIHLDYKQNFTLSFAALNYTSPQENRYFYKLENFDKDWNSVGTINTAGYTNLDPGEYTFKVRASSDAGEWNSPITSVKIYVRPPFWLTYYAYAFYLLVIGSILWTIRYLGIQKLKAKFALEQERNKVQQFIEEERREAERKHEFDQLKIKFLTNISHEFRTPISLIMGPVEQLLQQETGSEKSHQLNMVRRNARRLLNLVNQLLDFRNIKLKEQKLNNTEGDFISFSKDVAESFKDLADRKHINFEFKSSVRFYFTLFDHDKIERVLFNLLSNAFKFTLKDGEVKLKIDQMPHQKGLKVTLSDTGIGMEESVTEKVFDRFFQDDTNGEILNQGSGIGLSITKEFVRLHGGKIEVESIAGKGSVFTLYFPFRRLEDSLILEEDAVISDDFSSEMNSETAAESIDNDSNLPLILLVEDNEDFRFYLKDNLKSYYRIVEASNGKDGWQKVLSAHPELVVSDISMPHVTGTELCQKIKSDKRTTHIPVILLTALVGEEDQLLGLEKGANDYMAKPFNFEILNAKIRNLLTLNESLKTAYSKRIKVDTPEIEIESDNEKLLNKINKYVESNLTNPQLSVEDLSRHVGMSRGSLYTKILELTGETPVEFIRSIKLERAAILLDKSDMNISQVSYAVGFATPNYFARSFKAKFNLLPSEYITAKRNEKTHEKTR